MCIIKSKYNTQYTYININCKIYICIRVTEKTQLYYCIEAFYTLRPNFNQNFFFCYYTISGTQIIR